MNSYQRLKLKAEQREEELLDDIRRLIKGDWIDQQVVRGKYGMIEKMEVMLWTARSGRYTNGVGVDLDNSAAFSGLFNETNTNKDERPNE